ncbi:MAG: hypothetical protein ACKVJE_17325 [Pseudomonadales bacterium]
MPGWLVAEYQSRMPITSVRLGEGMQKQIFIGQRSTDLQTDYLTAFIELAKGHANTSRAMR